MTQAELNAGLNPSAPAPEPRAHAPGFDSHHAPDPEIIADCVHCGFCLPSCPTYVLWGEEMDSPRGRIQLMKMVSNGEIGLSETVTRHWDQCLGCMACVTACPSGVRYDRLIEATRPQVERHVPRSTSDRLLRELIFQLFPHPERMRALLPLLWAYQRSGASRVTRAPRMAQRLLPQLRAMEAMAPPVELNRRQEPLTEVIAARGQVRQRVALLLGCVQRVFFDEVNRATIRTLTAEGCEVVIPAGQGCCGALSIHAGREEEGLRYARRLIDSFSRVDVDAIVVNVAGCGSNMKDYAYLLRDDPQYAERAAALSAKTRDISEFLAALEPMAPRAAIVARVAYHDACHLAHAQGIRRQPRALLEAIPGLEVVTVPESELCCGSAGIYNLVEPEPAAQLGERKARNVLSVHPDALVASNAGCLLQITTALHALDVDLPTLHPIELVDASIRGIIPPALARVGKGIARLS
ncbi:MAG TPA: heterodisulfide reductase-related iron-sulfur binding cluster [Ktedonobacterales bacterium]|nr:heterodisulfide reductase-related iron-sulfur binding cluster [Ktedonobacterales bacterium]